MTCQQLHVLQEELLDLKKSNGSSLSLRKSTGGGSRGPFPVTVTARVQAPPAASNFDISFLQLNIQLEKTILGIRHGALKPASVGFHKKESSCQSCAADRKPDADSAQSAGRHPTRNQDVPGDASACADETDGPSGSTTVDLETAQPLSIQIASKDLPECLCKRIAADLEDYWRSRVQDVKTGYLLHGVLMKLKSNFIEYLRCMPNCIEGYESVNDAGATVRRYAFVEPAPSDATPSESICETGSPRIETGPLKSWQKRSCSQSVEDAANSVLDEPLATEVSMLKLRFGDSNFKLVEKGMSSDSTKAEFSARIMPSDPDWDSGELDFKGSLSVQKDGGLGVSLRLAPSVPLPWNVRIHVEGVLTREALRVKGQKNAGRALLKYVENHIAEDVEAGKTSFLDDDHCNHGELRTLVEVEETNNSSASACSFKEGSDHSSDEEVPEEDIPQPTFQGGDDGPAPSRSFSVELSGLKLDNVDVVEGLQICFQVSCSRCQALSSLSVVSPAICQGDSQNHLTNQNVWTSSGSCPNCHEDLSVSLNPKMLHDFSNNLGWLTPHGCIPVDLHPSQFMLQCTCGSVASVKNVQVGSNCERQCTQCRRAMALMYTEVCFSLQRSSCNTLSPAKIPRGLVFSKVLEMKKQKMRTSTPSVSAAYMPQRPLHVGEPLPNRGTCRHYHHSHRWLRFPCCGMRFPCDLCHEEFTDGHSMKWATRMVCGFCSLEQKLGDKCASCNKKLATTAANPLGRRTRFWEGGEGCRDRNRLDKRDSHKYTNSKAKTKSNKSNRVGPKVKKDKNDSKRS